MAGTTSVVEVPNLKPTHDQVPLNGIMVRFKVICCNITAVIARPGFTGRSV